MKKTRLSTMLLLMLILLCSIFILASCGGGGCNNGNPTPPTPTKLTAPTVTLINDTATWSADNSANKFEISVDGNLSYIENTVTSKKLSDGQTFKIRAIGDETNYTNSDWSNSVTYTKPISKYTITWKNGDIVLETDTEVSEGTVPTYDGEEPTKIADAQYSYVFAGWTPEIVAANGNVTYTAVFTSVLNKYTVTWKNGEDTLEIDENVTYGSIPSYDGATPTKAATAQYSYTFSGWTPQINSVTGSIVYQAQFTEILRTYTVTFYSEDGSTVLDTVAVEYGANAVYSKSTPVKNATVGHTYVFEKWVTTQGGSEADDLTNVIGDRSVYASFKEFGRTVTVYIISSNTDYGTVSVSTLNNVPYGETITVNGNTVTINGQTVTASANTATDQYTYTFVDWTADSTVGNDTIITANFSRSVNTYTITWKNGDTTLETDENVAYGTTPVYNGTLPTKDAVGGITYTFSGWSPSISSATADITYVAQFVTAENKYIVIFYDDDGVTELGRDVVGYGETAIYPNELPTKEATTQYIYTFDKWVTSNGSDEEAYFDNITEDKDVYAKYVATVRTYTVTFCDWDGTVLGEQIVGFGNNAIAPEIIPDRESDSDEFLYEFNSWDSSFENITKDTIIYATYKQMVEVTFVDHDDSIIDIQIISLGSSAEYPESPERANYKFVGWSKSAENVTQSITIMAEYEKLYEVVFVDFDGTVLKTMYLCKGDSAIAPSSPNRTGYTFTGWDSTYDLIEGDTIITALYRINKYTVTFVTPDGRTISLVEGVKYGFSVDAPIAPETWFDWAENKAYYFSGWNVDLSVITADTTVTALYEEEIAQPVIVVKSTSVTPGTINVSVKTYLCWNKEFYGLSLDTEFARELKLGGRISVDVNVAYGEEDNDYTTKLTDNCKYELRWTNSKGISPTDYSGPVPIMTFNFVLDEFQNGGEYFIELLRSTYIIDENFTKITPVVISGFVEIVA